MLDKVGGISLDPTKYPVEIVVWDYDGGKLKTLEFNTEDEALKVFHEMDKELFEFLKIKAKR